MPTGFDYQSDFILDESDPQVKGLFAISWEYFSALLCFLFGIKPICNHHGIVIELICIVREKGFCMAEEQ